MNEKYLRTDDNKLIEKLKSFIDKYSRCSEKRIETVIEIRNKVFGYRQIEIDSNELLICINNYLDLLIHKDYEATLCLDGLLDILIMNGTKIKNEPCFKCLISILSAIYITHFCDENESKSIFLNTCINNINDIFPKYKGHFRSLFFQNNEYECLIRLFVYSNIKYYKHEEKIIEESEIKAVTEFKDLLKRFYNAKKYNEAEIFFNKCVSICFKNTENTEVINSIATLKLDLLIKLGRLDEAIKMEYVITQHPDIEFKVIMMYNFAVIYSHKAELNELDDPEHEKNLNKAMEFIQKARALADVNRIEWKNLIVLQESFLWAELENYERAYENFVNVFNPCDTTPISKSNVNNLLWVLLKYLKQFPEKYQNINYYLKHINDTFSDIELKEYAPVLDFVFNDIYIRVNLELHNKVSVLLLCLLISALEIVHLAKIRDTSKFYIQYYTRIEHLKLLLEDELEHETNYRLPMFHSCHMNDPEEGKILRNYLLGNISRKDREKLGYLDSNTSYDENYVFLKSFFYHSKQNSHFSKEFLPMWVQYGNDAKGACIILNEKTFNKAKLRKVMYLNSEGKCENDITNKINELLSDCKKAFVKIVHICNNEINLDSIEAKRGMKKILELTEYIISIISFLFKDASYKHENEARLIITKTNYNLDKVRTIGGDIPKLFLYSDFQTYIDEIILGAKIDIPENHVPFIHKHGRKMWKNENGKEQIVVSKSSIQYR